MDGPSLEIDPGKFIVVLGPLFTAVTLKRCMADSEISAIISTTSLRSPPRLPTVDVRGMVDQGIGILLESSGQFQSEAELKECEQRYRDALKVDPLAKLSASMQQCGRYAEWLERCFKLDATAAAAAQLSRDSPAPSLTHLSKLQERGCLLVYTGCDDAISKLSNLPVLLPQDPDVIARWKSGTQRGILHVHGVYWQPESLQLNCEVYTTPSHPAIPAMKCLAQVFEEKFIISIGVCESQQISDNPMSARFASTFLCAACHQHCFNLDLPLERREQCRESRLLHLPLLEDQSGQPLPELAFVPLSETSKTLYAEIDFLALQQRDHQMMALVVSGKTEASEISKLMFSSPGVNFALMSSVVVAGRAVYTVSIRVESARLGELWAWLWEEKKAWLSSQGLLAVVLQSGTVVWLEGTPGGGLLLSDGQGVMETNTAGIQPKQEPLSPPVVPMETASMPQPHLQNHHAPLLYPHHPPHFQHASPSLGKAGTKLISPLVRQEFPIPKPGAKPVPRYTVTKLPSGSAVKPSGGGGGGGMVAPGTSFTLPAGNGLSKVHFGLHQFSDDTAMYSPQMSDLPKGVLGRRSSLPPSILATTSSSAHQPHPSADDSMLYKLAESVSTEPHPPSYTAIKQALLCDKYKRRQSMQTDPKTLKNLLQTKLVISERNDDLVNLRRKSDPGSYMKQRDFERRKELFLDENISWSKSYGKVIDHHIQRWQRKKFQRDLLSWQKAEFVNAAAAAAAAAAAGSTFNPLKLSMLNPLIATPQGMAAVNPLQMGVAAGAGPTLFPGTFLNPTAGGVATSGYILPQGMGAPTATPSATPIYYHPAFGTAQYAVVNPFSSLQLAPAHHQQQQQQQQQSSATYLTTGLAAATPQPSIYYYLPTTTSATPTAIPPHGGSGGGGVSSNGSQYGSLSGSRSESNGSLSMSPPGTSVGAGYPQQPTIHTPSPPPSGGVTTETVTPHPLSPNSRKRHQSVPEKLTSLLQLPPPLVRTPVLAEMGVASGGGAGAGRVSPMEVVSNPDSPPVSKKQRSTSDTILYHTSPYGLHPQLSPHAAAGGQRSPSSRHSTSPQPPTGNNSNNGGATAVATPTSFDGLSALQTHLLQVHQYGMHRTAQEERQRRRNRSHRDQVHSPRRKLSGGGGGRVGKNGSVSPISIQSLQSSEGEEGTEVMTPPAAATLHTTTPSPVMAREVETGHDNDSFRRENTVSEKNHEMSQMQLWQFLLDLLVSENTSLLQWTDNEFEFQITKPTELSRLWGQLMGTNGMTYEHLLAGLKCHFNQGIMSQVQGRKLTFRFAGHIRNYVQLRRSHDALR